MIFEYSKCFCDFSLILLIFVFLSYPTEMNEFSHSFLGKFCVIVLIVYYTLQNIIYGLLFCIITIYYYQLDHTNKITEYTEGFSRMNLDSALSSDNVTK
jgi:hypothetical protein